MSKFEIAANSKYLIVEKPDDSAPIELKRIGRAKRGGGFYELVGCPYDSKGMKYNTGLDKYCREFQGMSDEAIDKVLDERKALVQYYQRLLKASGLDEEDFLANYKLQIKHNALLDTSDMDTYLKLFFAMRGNKITPQSEKGNKGRYGASMYMIIDSKKKKDHKLELLQDKYRLIAWLQDKLQNNKDEAIEVLKYDRVIGLDQNYKSDALIIQAFERRISDIDVLQRVSNTIDNVKRNEIQLTLNVRKAISNGRISKERNTYIYDNVELGADEKAIVKNLQKKQFAEIAERIFE